MRLIARHEPLLIRLAGRRVAGDLDEDVRAEAKAGAGYNGIPVDIANRDVLASAPGSDWVALGGHRFDALEREEAERAFGPAVISGVVVAITCEAERGYLPLWNR